jgi:hypothetical protein
MGFDRKGDFDLAEIGETWQIEMVGSEEEREEAKRDEKG